MTDLRHPYPSLPIRGEFTYGLGFDVPAQTRLEAITEATSRLRSDLSLIAVQSAEPTGFAGGDLIWHVSLKVAEDA
jgi:hypothetical protein